MPEELFVDVRYRGLELGRRLRMEDFAASQAYIHYPAPMPVGTQLAVEATADLEIFVLVSRVNEQVAGAEKPSGMFVSPDALSSEAQVWWDDRVAENVSPVTAVKKVEALPEEPAEISRPADASVSEDVGDTQVMSAAAPEQPEHADPRSKKKRRKKHN